MKIFVLILVLLLGFIAYTLVSGNSKKTNETGKKQPVKTETVSRTQPSNQVQQPAQPSKQAQQPAQSKFSTVADEVNGVINYGIGATHLKAKQHSEARISNIKKKHNQQLEKALAE